MRSVYLLLGVSILWLPSNDIKIEDQLQASGEK